MEDKINIKKFTPIKGFDNYYIDKKGNIIKVKIEKVKIYRYEQNNKIIAFLNKIQRSVIKLFAETFIENPNNYKFASLINKKLGISIKNVHWTKFERNEYNKFEIYIVKNFIDRYDIEFCDKIYLKTYYNINDFCKELNLNKSNIYNYINRRILRLKNSTTRIFIKGIK